MTAIGISGLSLTGVIRMTWVHDHLAHVLDQSNADETIGTWTGSACPAYGLTPGTDMTTRSRGTWPPAGQITDLLWEAPNAIRADHNQTFQAAIRAYNAADTKRGVQLWESPGPLVPSLVIEQTISLVPYSAQLPDLQQCF